MWIRALSDVGWNTELIVKRDVHALPNQRQRTPYHNKKRTVVRVAYLEEWPIATVEDHLEGDVGPILNSWDTGCGGHNTDASSRAVALEIANDELVCPRSCAKVVQRRGGRSGREHHADCVITITENQSGWQFKPEHK